ncbi:hypothetical protein T4B_5488 [Trichinella pseudospiralis]|uniref:Uncharacterized protein n=1 Tax=Trichinella pseudospiralis TaxID=6337 RepID=A0A0V1GQ20_TRIPS|nr:hypothetical protein T4B_5488 [Trichinella pseudospiralis]
MAATAKALSRKLTVQAEPSLNGIERALAERCNRRLVEEPEALCAIKGVSLCTFEAERQTVVLRGRRTTQHQTSCRRPRLGRVRPRDEQRSDPELFEAPQRKSAGQSQVIGSRASDVRTTRLHVL